MKTQYDAAYCRDGSIAVADLAQEWLFPLGSACQKDPRS